MKNKNLITKITAVSLALLIAGSLTACKKDPEDVLSSTESSSSGYNALLNEEFSKEETSAEGSTAEYETLESGETVTNNEGQKVTKPPITADNSNRNVGGTQTTTKKASQGQPNGNTTKPDNPAPQPTQPQPTKPIIDPTTTTLPTPTPNDGKITQAQRDYMTNQFIEKALEIGFTIAMSGTIGAITGNYSGEVDKVTSYNYGTVYNSWMEPGGIESFYNGGYNELYVEWKDCGEYWEIYLQFAR